MDLKVAESFNRRLITPHVIGGQTYYLLFHKDKVPGPFLITSSPYKTNSFLYIGEIKTLDEQIVGNIFYTQAHVVCAGGYLLAYSGMFKGALNKRLPKDLDMSLVLKTPFMHVFSQKNKATLVVSPMLKKQIRENLEV